MRKVSLVLALALCGSTGALASQKTIKGFVSSGNNFGLIFNDKRSVSYGEATKNLKILTNACPLSMGEEVACVIRFKELDGFATEIISARSLEPKFSGIVIDRPGSVFDASVCTHPKQVDYILRPGCQHFDELRVHVKQVNGPTVEIVWNGQLRYALSQRVTINCNGTAVSLASFLGRNIPDGTKPCW